MSKLEHFSKNKIDLTFDTKFRTVTLLKANALRLPTVEDGVDAVVKKLMEQIKSNPEEMAQFTKRLVEWNGICIGFGVTLALDSWPSLAVHDS